MTADIIAFSYNNDTSNFSNRDVLKDSFYFNFFAMAKHWLAIFLSILISTVLYVNCQVVQEGINSDLKLYFILYCNILFLEYLVIYKEYHDLSEHLNIISDILGPLEGWKVIERNLPYNKSDFTLIKVILISIYMNFANFEFRLII